MISFSRRTEALFWRTRTPRRSPFWTTAPFPPAPVPAAPGAPGYDEIDVHRIDPSPYQARREITAEQLNELAESIRAEGLLQPVVVRKTGDRFQLIAGERRWRAVRPHPEGAPARLALRLRRQPGGLHPRVRRGLRERRLDGGLRPRGEDRGRVRAARHPRPHRVARGVLLPDLLRGSRDQPAARVRQPVGLWRGRFHGRQGACCPPRPCPTPRR